jgi:hypothetical protein
MAAAGAQYERTSLYFAVTVLAYFATVVNYACKKFITLASKLNVLNQCQRHSQRLQQCQKCITMTNTLAYCTKE